MTKKDVKKVEEKPKKTKDVAGKKATKKEQKLEKKAEKKSLWAKIKGLKTWQKVLLSIGGFLLIVIIAAVIFVWVNYARIDGFLHDNFGTVQTDARVEDVTKDPFIMYISSIDDRDGNLPEKARSDLNILAVVNPAKKKILLVNIPRDYFVKLHGLDGYDKLTHAGDIGGLELSKTTIEDLLDVKINYATRVNFNLLEGLVDAVGGVDIENGANDFTTYWNENCRIVKGMNNLDGECAVAYARERIAVGGDLYRAENEEKVMTAVFNKISSDAGILLNYGAILDSLAGNFETSFSADEVKNFAVYMAGNGSGWKTEEFNLLTAGSGQEYGYLYPEEQHFVFYVDQNSVSQAHDKILQFMSKK